MKKPRCFISGPASKEFQPVRAAIVDALQSVGIEALRWEELGVTATPRSEVTLREIERADLIIADLTKGNPGVLYEVGLAHGLKKPVLPIVQRDVGKIPFDLGGYLYLVYDPTDLGALRDQIMKWSSRVFAAA